MHESNAFSISTTESLSSHIFRATHAVNIYKGKAVENAREELGHRFASTTINSYIKPEKRQLNVLEEKNIDLFDSLKILEPNKLKRPNTFDKNKKHKENISEIDESIESININDEISLSEEDEDFIDDHYELNESIFYLTGHFYDDTDFLIFKTAQQNKNFNSNINYINNYEKELNINLNQKECNKEIFFKDSHLKYIKLNKNNDKEKSVNNKNSLSNTLKIKDFKEGLIIKETEKDMIISNKIKNKKELHILSFEQNSILEKTVELNKKGFFYNVKANNNNGESIIVSTYKIPKNTLLTIIGGTVYYKKNYIISSKQKDDKSESKIILEYFKTAKKDYDRIIEISNKSIVKFLFPKFVKDKPNLEILKVVDSKNLVKLLVITNKYILAGNTLLLDKNLILNKQEVI